MANGFLCGNTTPSLNNKNDLSETDLFNAMQTMQYKIVF